MSAIVRNTIKGMPNDVAIRATMSLSRSTTSAPVAFQTRLFSICVARSEPAPKIDPSTAPIAAANWLKRAR